MIILADTCGIIAAYDETHPQGDACLKVLDEAGLIVISPLVLAEVDHMGRKEFGYESTALIMDDIQQNAVSGRYVIPEVTPDILAGAARLRARHRGLSLDLSDAVTMTLAAVYDTDAVLTIDRRDFRAVTPLSRHSAFRLLPDDL
ncbi:type II toxin-antitoxin system VapC family toxin [Streptomyces bottropensis]|uniref:type II toxin-antitoxin system VapC family toxin n=1 Tax=Streptomyces bottropensis TaxID=42235 RepID=UPI0036B8696F